MSSGNFDKLATLLEERIVAQIFGGQSIQRL